MARPRHTILVVDDEPAARFALRRVFESEYQVCEAGSVPEARVSLKGDRPVVVLLDYSMPGEDGLVLLRELAGRSDAPAVVMITAHGSERLAVEAMKAGAYDYLAKPYDLDELRLVVSRAVERQELRLEVQDLRQLLAEEGQFGRMIGASAAMRDVFHTAARVAPTDLPVLLLGESGTGKDLLAQEIHARSARSKARFVALNCSALPESLVESELFGYEKGAFTGAVRSNAGRFEMAHRGVLFLDEIGEMAPHIQPKILRAAESGAIERLGGAQTIHVDVRLISATNQDLQLAVRDGRFREDLYYRLAGVTLRLPPLRERGDDILILAERFWADLQRKYGRQGPALQREALLRIRAQRWPGNVRQLRNFTEKLFVLARGDAVTAADVDIVLAPDSSREAPLPDGPFAAPDYRDARRLFETEYLRLKLKEHGGNVTRTAQAIGLERQSLQEKIRKLGVSREEAEADGMGE
ncbi:MAG: sigma-54-dependent Fis family transcriptional regulator [Bryobacteraceae bacterium]|nr:sigma-54-dependent Fis family transcriptional regulator [Bryobacteraceae bacterium]